MSDGVLYVEIMPSTKGIGKAVEGDLNKQFKNAEKTGDGFFSKVGKWAKGGAIAIGGMVAGIATLALTGGISRALNIEDAQAKLKGLGHDTKSVEAIMKDALASVKGTAFGLDAAATTAAAAVASGIKPGKELEGYLRLTADAATIAGVSMEEMGSIMNKVQAKGKAQMEDLNRLTERGIPIMQMLADEYGVTAEEMSAMVSRGEVDSERFRAALEKNLGGAALESGNTTRGAFANMRAALSRLGLAFVGDGLSGAKTFFNEITVILDGLTERVGPWVEKIQDKLGGLFKLDGMGDNFLDWLDRAASTLSSGPLPQLLSALSPLLPALGEVARLLGPALADAAGQLAEALLPIIPELVDALIPAIVELAPLIADLLVEILPLLPPLLTLGTELLPYLVDVLKVLLPIITDLTSANLGMVSAFIGLFDVISGDTSLDEWRQDLAESENWMGRFITSLTETAIQVGFYLGKIRVGFETMRDQVAQVMATVGVAIATGWNGAVTAIATGVTRAVVFVQTFPTRLRAALATARTWLLQTGRNIVQGLIDGIQSMWNSAISAVTNLGNALPAGIKKVLGIHSPSRVFRDQVGKMVGLGLLAGIEDASIGARIDTAVNHMIDVPASGGGSSSGMSVTFTGPVYGDPEHLMETAYSKQRRAQATYGIGEIR